MRRAVSLIALSSMALATGTSRAMADVGVIAFSGQSSVELTALYDPGGARMSGVSVGGFGDINGIGLSLSADYQRLRGAAGAAGLHSAAVALGLRVSALALASRREEIWRWFDASVGAGFEGGQAARTGAAWPIQGRGSVWLEGGVTARLGVTARSPGLGIHYRRRMARTPEPLPEHMVMLTLSLAWTRTSLARYR